MVCSSMKIMGQAKLSAKYLGRQIPMGQGDMSPNIYKVRPW